MSLYTGHFSRTSYDKCYYPEDLSESIAPYEYVMNTDRIHNCNGCLTTFGPRAGLMGNAVSNISGNGVAAAQDNIDVDSIMSNRNVPLSRCKRGKVNPINVTQIRTVDLPVCNDYLDAQHTKMTDPPMFYRGVATNRFFTLNKDPQKPVFYDYATNTRLEAKDNFIPRLPRPLTHVDMVPSVPKNSGVRPKDPSWKPQVKPIRKGLHCKGNRKLKCNN
jgi:hypothetical protein